MNNYPIIVLLAAACGLVLFAATNAFAQTPANSESLGGGFFHHGVATPVSMHRGTVSTVDGEGNNVVLVWLFDHRGGYGILMINAATGEAQTFPTPAPTGGDTPFASILSSDNKYYSHFGGQFYEFDPAKPGFTFHHATMPRVAMSMTEDDDGVIWAATYPSSGLVSFDPKTKEFNDYGFLNNENWPQYQRDVAADDTGWIYFAVGNTMSHVIGFNPRTGQSKPMIPDEDRAKGRGTVARATDGNVYGLAASTVPDSWYVFHNGEATRLGEKPQFTAVPYVASHQGLFHRDFPDGSRLIDCDLIERKLVVADPDGNERTLSFDYDSEGAHIMGIETAPDGTICGGTAFPMRFFSYNPADDIWINRAAYGQWNTVVTQGDRFFVGAYGHGILEEWDPAAEWVPTVKNDATTNPAYLAHAHPAINRPHDLLAYTDGKTIVLAGTPAYGDTGGGLLFFDRETREHVVLTHNDILPQLSTMSLVALPDRKMLAGGTISAGTGGEVLAGQAQMYIMDIDSKEVIWHDPVFPGTKSFTDLCADPRNGLVYGFTDVTRFFVFDAAKREVVYERETETEFGRANYHQGPRTFVTSPDGTVYILFVKGVATVDPKTYEITMLAESPVSIGPGGSWHDGRIYFGSGSHLYSFQPQAR
jgi:hypothetical protein